VVVHALEELEAELAALAGAETGSLRLASCDSFGNYVLPSVLRAFARERPRAEIHVRVGSSGEVVRAVARGEAHLGIAGQTRRSERVVAESLLRDELVWVVSARAQAGPRTVADLPALTLIVPGSESSTRATTERILGRLAGRPGHIVELDSVEAVKRAVRSELGIALVSRLSVTDELATGELLEVHFLGAGDASRTIEILHSAQRTPTPLEQVFKQILRQHCADLRRSTRPRNAATEE
jgi:DNA-binding transcriptional LysR family regulator